MAVATGPGNKPILTGSYESTNDLSAKQFYGVKFSANRTIILCTAVTDVPAGILMNKPTAGQDAEVLHMGISKCLAGETLAAGNQIRVHSDGKWMVFAPDTDTTAYGVGVCTQGAAADELAEGMFNFASPDRGEE